MYLPRRLQQQILYRRVKFLADHQTGSRSQYPRILRREIPHQIRHPLGHGQTGKKRIAPFVSKGLRKIHQFHPG
jgi:hypothetical protein